MTDARATMPRRRDGCGPGSGGCRPCCPRSRPVAPPPRGARGAAAGAGGPVRRRARPAPPGPALADRHRGDRAAGGRAGAVRRGRVAAEAEGGRYLAVVQGGGALPALIVRVDTRTGTAQVRPVGAEAPRVEACNFGMSAPRAEAARPRGSRCEPGEPAPGRLAGRGAGGVRGAAGRLAKRPARGPVVYTGKLIAE